MWPVNLMCRLHLRQSILWQIHHLTVSNVKACQGMSGASKASLNMCALICWRVCMCHCIRQTDWQADGFTCRGNLTWSDQYFLTVGTNLVFFGFSRDFIGILHVFACILTCAQTHTRTLWFVLGQSLINHSQRLSLDLSFSYTQYKYALSN